jgi:hypothetical protein
MGECQEQGNPLKKESPPNYLGSGKQTPHPRYTGLGHGWYKRNIKQKENKRTNKNRQTNKKKQKRERQKKRLLLCSSKYKSKATLKKKKAPLPGIREADPLTPGTLA